MILVDSSVWIKFLHGHQPELAIVLENGLVVTHPFVIGELACGTVRARKQTFEMLRELPQANSVDDEEALALIDRQSLMGKGLSYIDVHLLASAIISDGVELWTADKRLASVANALNVAYRTQRH